MERKIRKVCYGIDDVIYLDELKPFEKKFKEFLEFFRKQGLISKKEYKELLEKLEGDENEGE